jgi:hypothetical protein
MAQTWGKSYFHCTSMLHLLQQEIQMLEKDYKYMNTIDKCFTFPKGIMCLEMCPPLHDFLAQDLHVLHVHERKSSTRDVQTDLSHLFQVN